jgi:hypothetical protein
LLIHIEQTEASVIIRPPNNLGLVGYWSFDEGRGTQAGDMSGNGNDGALNGATEWVSGKSKGALGFDGADSFVNIQGGWLYPSQTISFWAKPLDVLIQQLLIIWLTTKLYANGLSLKQIITFFLVAFGSIHIFQVLKTDWVIGLVFTAGALVSSVLYPYLLLRVRNGYIYNYMIHLGLYSIAALVAWMMY